MVELTDLQAATAEDFIALKGAALVLAERGAEAQKTLKDPRLDDFQDMALWRGAAADLVGDQEAAIKNFDKGDPSLQAYPVPLKPKLLVRRLNTALEAEQFELAKQWRDRITDEIDTYGQTYKARLDYLFGRLYRMELDLDNAVGSFQTAKDSGDLYSSVRAEYELTDLNLQQETIELEEAIQRL
ncbi:MAG: UvrB/UvrC motif-containing protein, partial [Alphaproteobacteria bacterium]|nr:UvrB/UvrC motif-containing protein [Alphaproteobacteria bacterium]